MALLHLMYYTFYQLLAFDFCTHCMFHSGTWTQESIVQSLETKVPRTSTRHFFLLRPQKFPSMNLMIIGSIQRLDLGGWSKN